MQLTVTRFGNKANHPRARTTRVGGRRGSASSTTASWKAVSDAVGRAVVSGCGRCRLVAATAAPGAAAGPVLLLAARLVER